MVLTSLAWMACPPAVGDTASADVSSSSGAEAHPQQQQLQKQQQDSSAQALLLQQLGQRLEQQLDVFEPEDTCHCLWALTKLGGLEARVLAAATAHSLSLGWLQLLTAKPLSSLLWVHAHNQQEQQQHMQDQQQQLVAAVVRELQQPGFLATWTPQELSMLLWSCAVLGVPLEQQQQQQQSVQLPLSVLQEVCRLCREHVVQFTPQGITMVCWSLSQLIAAAGSSSSSDGPQQQQKSGTWPLLPSHLQQQVLQLLTAFTGSAAAQLQFYKPQEVANLFGACARLAVPSRALSTAVGGYVTHHGHLLGGRDVTELLLGFVQQHVSPEPAALRALLHRAGQLAQQAALTPYQLAGTAWCCVKLGGSYVSSSGGGQRQQDARSGGSPAALLQQECAAAAASLLSVLEGKVVEAAAAGDVSPQAVWERVFPGSSQHPKQAVIVAWTLAATQPPGISQGSSSSSSVLGAAVLQQLRAISGSCDCDTAVQVLCVLVRLTAAGGAPAHHELVAAACEASVRMVLSGLHSLPPQDAVTAAWAAVKLQKQLSNSSNMMAGDGSPVVLLAAVVGRLQQQQQLAGLPVHLLVALLWGCRAARWLPPPAAVTALATAAYNRVLQLGSEELMAVVLALAHFQQQQQQQQLPPHQQAQLQQLLSRVAARVARQLLVLLEQECQRDVVAAGSGLQPGQLVAVAMACSHLQELQVVPVLLVELWQLQLQAGAVSTQQALQMVAALAECQQQQLQQQVVPLLLQHALGMVAQQLSTTHQQVPTASAGLAAAQALYLCTKLRYQPQPQVLALLCRQLCASLPVLPDKQLVMSLHALAHLGAPAQQPAAALLQALLHRQQQQQRSSGKRWTGLPHHLAVQCLWSALLLGVHTPQLTAGSSTRRFLVMLAHQVSDVFAQQLLRAPHLLQLALQARQLLKQGAHQRLHRALRVLRVVLPAEGLLTQQLAGMTQLLLPEGLVGSSRRQALARLLSAAPQQLPALVAQQQEEEQQQAQPHQPMQACWQQLLPLWQHQQLQQACLQRLAVRVAAAQARAKQPAATAKLRHLPSGDVALLLLPAQRPGQRQPKGVAVLLESGSDVAANTGWQLGPSLARQAALQAQGYSVHTLPLACWVPGWLAQQQQQPQRQAGASRRGKLLVARHNQLRRLVAALRPLPSAGSRRRRAGGAVQVQRAARRGKQQQR
jgi:hypothetical protein